MWLGEDRQTEDMCVKYKVCLYRCACKEQSMLGSSKDKGETHIERGLGISMVVISDAMARQGLAEKVPIFFVQTWRLRD